MASVSVDYVRDAVNVGSAVVPDVKVLKMVKRAEVTLELEADRVLNIDLSVDSAFLGLIWK